MSRFLSLDRLEVVAPQNVRHFVRGLEGYSSLKLDPPLQAPQKNNHQISMTGSLVRGIVRVNCAYLQKLWFFTDADDKRAAHWN
eukprot:scaffold1658_cov160-Skeletonema_menzelii.AAC.3